MAKAASLAERLGKHLECAVCLEQYTEPKVLPCLHSFCKRCLHGLLTREGTECKISCPTCRSIAEVSFNNSLGILKTQQSLCTEEIEYTKYPLPQIKRKINVNPYSRFCSQTYLFSKVKLSCKTSLFMWDLKLKFLSVSTR